jgi:hypothetical protein
MNYLDVKQIIEISGKSNSTIRRMINQLRDNITEIQKNYSSPIFNNETLRNNQQKVYVLEDVVVKYFGLKVEEEEKKTTQRNEYKEVNDNQFITKTFERFERELDFKNKELEDKGKTIMELVERQRELHILLKKSEERISRLENYFDKQNQPKLQNYFPGHIKDVKEEDEYITYSHENPIISKGTEDVDTPMNKSNEEVEMVEEKETMSGLDHLLKNEEDDKPKSFSYWINNLEKLRREE